MVETVQKYPFWGLKNSKTIAISGASSKETTRVMNLDPTTTLTASPAHCHQYGITTQNRII